MVINPGDALEAQKAVIAAAKNNKPTYIRFGRSATPVFTTSETPFEIGKVLVVWKSDKPKVTIISTGSLTYNALLAVRALESEGISSTLIHVHTIKPLDEETILHHTRITGKVITIEEHQVAGGMGSAVAELLSQKAPAKILRMGIHDTFGQSGTPEELLEEYGLGVTHIIDTARSLMV